MGSVRGVEETELDEGGDGVELGVNRRGGKLVVDANEGNGFVVPEDEVVAMRRAGKQVLNMSGTDEAIACAVVQGDHVAVIGDNRKLLIFPLKEMNEMTRGKGVRLQRYKDGGLSDALVFTLADGFKWSETGGRTRHVTEADLAEYLAKRATAGRMAPRGFPRDNRFQ